jgi:pimeloyl-ACP methyl ester carboxylesterase
LRQAGRGALALLIVLAVSGVVAERVMRRNARERFPVHGRLVSVDGMRPLQLDCRGAGSPTVVLESGLDMLGSLSWMSVIDSIARTTRVCAYSRAGIMWSEPSGTRFDSRKAVRDVHAALVAAGEPPPYVMVGHSIGAAYVMRFTDDYPTEVAGLVLVDPSHPGQFAEFAKATGKSILPSSTGVRVAAALAWTGLLRLLPEQNPPSWPVAVRAAAAAFLPTSLAAAGEEGRAIAATLADAGTIHNLGARPLIVLSAASEHPSATLQQMGLTRAQGMRLQATQHRLHAALASMSRNGRQQLVRHSSHYIQLDQPAVVVRAIEAVVAAVRATRFDDSAVAAAHRGSMSTLTER